ncbi:MAG: alpha/beta hydrolase [Actinobacteria bacterium]|jgi:pimeloyl-ACP methyl ester carboxylesterase|nr:alpha/beta hydrolase [Micrococcales bacterium]MCB0903925.1 alpha/beta hydrolase [Actinomycetota bacterium]MCO5299878.1 alpha/beta fold hydrolase [Candidatus Nanopelagicales bacterium]MCB9429652.1 alpha/beta hydrolase [Actinomycetota bacterium]HPE12697.1 alpha/beta fold hydrolase [Actinomycetota bacterium]
MPIAVPIVAGTAIRGVAATLMMRRVLERHPNAFLITLASFGVTLPLHKSQEHISEDIQRGLHRQGRDPDSPVVLVGHSQGALASLRYAVDHPNQVLHVVSVGSPWNGSHSAKRVARLLRWAPRDITPALTDMAEGSPFLAQLHDDLPAIADRVTNIYSTHELFMTPYTAAHIDVPGVVNHLIATESEYRRHLAAYPDLPVDGHIEGRITHLGEMSAPEVRAVIWAKVEEIADQVRRGEIGGRERPA